MDLSAAVSVFSRNDFLLDGSIHAASISAVAGIPYMQLAVPGRKWLRSLGPEGSMALPAVPESDIRSGVRAAWPNSEITELFAPQPDDSYGHLREGSLPPSAIRVVLDDADETWLHIDGSNGQILSVMDRSRRVYRWLFNGLHSLDFPGFVDRRPAWDMVMLSLLCLGFAFSVTAVMLGQKRLKRSARKGLSRSRDSAS